MDGGGDPERAEALKQYRNKLLESREWEAKLKNLRMDLKGLAHDFDVTEDNIKALQSVGQIIGEVLKQLDEERCTFFAEGVSGSEDFANVEQSLSKPRRAPDMWLVVGQRSTERNSNRAPVSLST